MRLIVKTSFQLCLWQKDDFCVRYVSKFCRKFAIRFLGNRALILQKFVIAGINFLNYKEFFENNFRMFLREIFASDLFLAFLAF